MKVKLQDIYDELSEEVDSAVADKFYKGLKPKVDTTDRIDLDDVEVQLYIRDFMNELIATKDYQADIANNILKQYYNTEYDVYDEIEESNKLEEADSNYIILHTGLTDENAYEVLQSVLGQLSDGIWENSPSMDKYWAYADIIKDGSEVCISVNTSDYRSGFRGKSGDEILKYFATKVKQIVKEEGLEWKRDNTEVSSYLARNNEVTVQDAYRVYDKLLGRKDRIDVKTEAAEDDYENTFAKIIDQMEEAISYDELYDAANDIIDEDLKSKVIEAIKQCDVDGDPVNVAYSVVTSDLLDMKRYDLNEAKKLNENVDIDDLFNKYTDIARDTYELEWNSADAKDRKELAKKAITKFVQEYPEVKKVVKEFADRLEDENYHTDREALNDLYKFESKKQIAFSKRLIKEDNGFEQQVSLHDTKRTLYSEEELECFNAVKAAIGELENYVSNFNIDLGIAGNRSVYVEFKTYDKEGEFVARFSTTAFGEIESVKTTFSSQEITADFLYLAGELDSIKTKSKGE